MNHAFEFILGALCLCLPLCPVQAYIYACNTSAPCGCSQNKVVINSRIVGGEPSAVHSWGWAVSLRIGSKGHFCGGSIISAHYVLTAAHCVEDSRISSVEITAAVGTDTLSDGYGQRILVSKIYIHPKWNTYTKENDIALLKLEKAISFNDRSVAKLCLPSLIEYTDVEFPWINTELVAIGWGSTASGGISSPVLRQVALAAVGSKEAKCSNSIRNSRLQFCAAVNGGGKGNTLLFADRTFESSSLFTDTCQGDSGGPLMYYSYEYEQWMVAGITSYGYGCGLSGYAGVYARASMYISWIKSIVGNDGVVIAGENGANVGAMSNVIFITILSLSLLLRSFE